jgi:hypothetical protein
VDEISSAQFETLDSYKETDNRYAYFDTERMIRMFWKLIQDKARVLKNKKHIFCYKRSQRQDYLASMSAG